MLVYLCLNQCSWCSRHDYSNGFQICLRYLHLKCGLWLEAEARLLCGFSFLPVLECHDSSSTAWCLISVRWMISKLNYNERRCQPASRTFESVNFSIHLSVPWSVWIVDRIPRRYAVFIYIYTVCLRGMAGGVRWTKQWLCFLVVWCRAAARCLIASVTSIHSVLVGRVVAFEVRGSRIVH